MEDEHPAADGGPLGAPAEPQPVAPAPPRRRVRRRLILALLALLLVAVVAAAVVAPPARWPWEPQARTPAALGSTSAPPTSAPATSEPVTTPSATASPAPADRPTAGGATTRLGVAPVPPLGGGSHAFATFQENGVTPVAYDPCRQVHYVIRPDQAPEGGEAMIHAAVARLSETTGLQFVYDGPTDEVPSADRRPFQPDRYGDRWAPVLVAWQTAAEEPALAGDIVGQGGSVAVWLGDGPRTYVTGSVVLDSVQFPDIMERRNGPAIAEGIVLHEFGHLAGLDHVDDEDELMYPETAPGVTDFAEGDLEGLSRLGRGPCVPEL